MRKDDLNVHVAQNLIDYFFSNFDYQRPSIERILSEKKYGVMGLISENMEAFECRT